MASSLLEKEVMTLELKKIYKLMVNIGLKQFISEYQNT